MKKTFFATLMLLVLGGIINAQTSTAKTNTNQKKTVSAVSPAKTTKSTPTVTKTTAKPATATTPSNQVVPGSAIGKHKRAHHTAKKHK